MFKAISGQIILNAVLRVALSSSLLPKQNDMTVDTVHQIKYLFRLYDMFSEIHCFIVVRTVSYENISSHLNLLRVTLVKYVQINDHIRIFSKTKNKQTKSCQFHILNAKLYDPEFSQGH